MPVYKWHLLTVSRRGENHKLVNNMTCLLSHFIVRYFLYHLIWLGIKLWRLSTIVIENSRTEIICKSSISSYECKKYYCANNCQYVTGWYTKVSFMEGMICHKWFSEYDLMWLSIKLWELRDFPEQSLAEIVIFNRFGMQPFNTK